MSPDWVHMYCMANDCNYDGGNGDQMMFTDLNNYNTELGYFRFRLEWSTGDSIDWSQVLSPMMGYDMFMNPFDIILTNSNGVGVDTPAFAGLCISGQIQFSNMIDGAAPSFGAPGTTSTDIFYSVALWEQLWIGSGIPDQWGGVGHPTWADSWDTFNGIQGTGADWVQLSAFRMDECAEGTHNCHENADCTPVVNSYSCECSEGYDGDGTVECNGINECLDETDNCPDEATCVDTDESFDCECDEGYLFNTETVTCDNIDECADDTDNCPETATCVDNDGSFDCDCDEGYVFNTQTVTCDNIDECLDETDNCPERATCVDTDGSFDCDCDEGYSWDITWDNNIGTVTCNNIDECMDEIDDCPDTATCVDTEGSFNCESASTITVTTTKASTTLTTTASTTTSTTSAATTTTTISTTTTSTTTTTPLDCPDGFTSDGTSCIDIDECLESPCQGSNCFNIAGSYICGNALSCFDKINLLIC